MVKVKKILTVCGLAAVAGVMWLVSACTQSVTNSVPGQPIKAANIGTLNSTATGEPSILNNAATMLPATAPEDSPTTTLPPVTSTFDPEGRTTPADIGSYVLHVTGLVNNPSALSYAQILSLPAVSKKVGFTARV